jgi:hypothetical protein
MERFGGVVGGGQASPIPHQVGIAGSKRSLHRAFWAAARAGVEDWALWLSEALGTGYGHQDICGPNILLASAPL